MSGNIIVVERELLNSNAFRELSGTAKTVYFDFRMKIQGAWVKIKKGRKEFKITNNGEIQYSYAEAEGRGIRRAGFMRAIDSLIERGLLDLHHRGSGTRKGDVSLYGISERWRAFGTDKFIEAKRQKDTRRGRGFKVGHEFYGKRKDKL